MDQIAGYDQARVDRLCQAVGWAGANPETAQRLANMSVDESGLGSREPKRRGKVLGILRDALRQKSMGIIEELPEKGIVKYAKPAGVICEIMNDDGTMARMGDLVPFAKKHSLKIGAIEDLRSIRSDDPAAAEALRTIRLTRRNLEDLWMPAIVEIIRSDAMLSWTDAQLEHPVGWWTGGRPLSATPVPALLRTPDACHWTALSALTW